MNLNSVMLFGRVVATPELVDTRQGGKLVRLRLMINDVYKAANGYQVRASFLTVKCYNTIALIVIERAQVGTEVLIQGRLSAWAHKVGEQRVGRLDVVAHHVQFVRGTWDDTKYANRMNAQAAEFEIALGEAQHDLQDDDDGEAEESVAERAGADDADHGQPGGPEGQQGPDL